MAALPSGSFRFTVYDGNGLGSNLISLTNVNPNLLNKGEILTNADDLKKALKELQAHIPYVIQKVLSLKYSDKTLYQYNQENPGNTIQYQFLVITDFPRTLDTEAFNLLEMILKNGRKAGVYVILSIDTTYQKVDSYNAVPITRLLDYATTIYESGDRYYIKNIEEEDCWRRFKMTLNEDFLNDVDGIINFINSKKEDKRVSKIDLEEKMPSEDYWWNRDSSGGVSIPFGVTNRSKVVNLDISQVSGQNVAVVVGIPGSGKSVFLNSIIASSAIHYSPDELELYLIDFSGVEFNVYADYELPHARVIAPESEREFGVSVLKRIKEEGNRRMEIFRQAGVNNITDYRKENPDKRLPRILIIIDEFQKLFSDDTDSISLEAENIIHTIVQEYRKFGINLILATQSISKYTGKIELGMIANRIAFEWKEDDTPYLFSGETPIGLINEPGDCIYNFKAGKPNGNIGVKSYFISQKGLQGLTKQIHSHAVEKGSLIRDKIIFRSNAPAIFENNQALGGICKDNLPAKVKVYLGESIALSDEDTNIELQRGSNSNILIAGGQNSDAGLRIAVNSIRSVMLAYNDNMANFLFFNYIPDDNPHCGKAKELYGNVPFVHEFVAKDKQEEYLMKLKCEIERRQTDSLIRQRHVYLSIYNFQFAHNFNRKSEWDLSESARMLSFIIEHGPTVGVFTIMQVDELSSLVKYLDRGIIDKFNHRVVLQMSENDSIAIMDNRMGCNIYVENKPSSKNRAYYYDKSNNYRTKFKPYNF